jgi:hypothetical protein
LRTLSRFPGAFSGKFPNALLVSKMSKIGTKFVKWDYSHVLQEISWNHIVLFQHLVEDSDELWEIHCKTDFKQYTPDELENWRELYLVS